MRPKEQASGNSFFLLLGYRTLKPIAQTSAISGTNEDWHCCCPSQRRILEH